MPVSHCMILTPRFSLADIFEEISDKSISVHYQRQVFDKSAVGDSLHFFRLKGYVMCDPLSPICHIVCAQQQLHVTPDSHAVWEEQQSKNIVQFLPNLKGHKTQSQTSFSEI